MTKEHDEDKYSPKDQMKITLEIYGDEFIDFEDEDELILAL